MCWRARPWRRTRRRSRPMSSCGSRTPAPSSPPAWCGRCGHLPVRGIAGLVERGRGGARGGGRRRARPDPSPDHRCRGGGTARHGHSMIVIDGASPVPPYEQLRAQLAGQIQDRTLAVGARLPTIRRLAADLGLAVNTVGRAYRELEEAGLIGTRGRAARSSPPPGSRPANRRSAPPGTTRRSSPGSASTPPRRSGSSRRLWARPHVHDGRPRTAPSSAPAEFGGHVGEDVLQDVGVVVDA